MTQVTQMTQMTQEGGNTITPSLERSRSRKWCFTLNNPSETECDTMTQEFRAGGVSAWIVGKEVGESGTPHLQGYIEYDNARTFKSVQKSLFNRAHIEKAKGSKQSNYDYCSKDNNILTEHNMAPLVVALKQMCMDEYRDVVWKPWQQNIIDLLKTKPDPRVINWFWDEDGNIGKTYLCKYLAITSDVIICDGKKDNVFNQVKMTIDEGKIPSIIIMDVPRTATDFINYGVLESLKNGLMYSGKYEGGQCIFPHPHVVVFANVEPDRRSMSKDRWNIIKV